MGRNWLMSLLRLLLQGWGMASVLFILLRTLPNEQRLVARFAELSSGGTAVSAARVQAAQLAVQQRLGLAEPVFYVSLAPTQAGQLQWRWRWNGPRNQYHRWLGAILWGNLGRSYRTDEPVAELLVPALRQTLPLMGLAILLIVALALPLGLWLAQTRSSSWVLTGLLALDALPLFVVALLLLLLLASPDFLMLLPVYGLSEAADENTWAGLLRPEFTALPLASLVLSGVAEPAVQLAATLRHEARLDYMLTARAKGLSVRQALRRHALRNALLPLFTALTELVPVLLAGSVVVELVFAMPGLGRLLAEAAAAHDYPVLLGGVLAVLVARLLALFLADRLYRWADPRLRVPVYG